MADAYAWALAALARREVCEAQVRARLARRGHLPGEIDVAVARLRASGTLDDARTARAFARTETRLRHRSRRWVLRRLQAMGIDRPIAEAAAAEVFDELDEGALLDAVLDRRLRAGADPADPAVQRRLHRYLLGQGFEPERVLAALRARTRR
jgi:SOS response regulatory protein OraA/RecX